MRIARDQSIFQNQVVVAKFSLIKEASLHTYYGIRQYSCPYSHSANLKSLVEFTSLCNQQMPPPKKSVSKTIKEVQWPFELLTAMQRRI